MQESDATQQRTEEIRDLIAKVVDETSPVTVGDEIGVHPQVLRDFIARKVDRPRGDNWVRILEFAESVRNDKSAYRSRGRTVQRVGETRRGRQLQPAGLRTAELRGRSLEVESLLAYALERQRLLSEALGAPQSVGAHPDWVTSDELDADDEVIDRLESAAEAARAAVARSTSQKKSATG